MKSDYDCCTHYREKGYDDGYIMLPIFRVKVCPNCGARMGKEDEHEASK